MDFFASWCGPCQMMGPIVDSLANEYESSKVKIAKMSVEENQVVPGKYQVMSIPAFLVFKNGEVVDQVVGGVPKEKLVELIEKHS